MFNPFTDAPGLVSGSLEFVLGILFFPTVFFTCQYMLKYTWLGAKFCQQFKLKNHGIYDISNKLTSTTFAILACSCGLYVYSNCGDDVFKDRFYILDNYLIFGVSYFFYDIGSMYMVYRTQDSEDVNFSAADIIRFLVDRPLILLHHLLVPVIGFPTMMIYRGGQGDCMLGTSFLVEASTPFVSLRVILVHLGLKNSRLYMVNGVLMVVTFFLCRIAIFPVLYCWYIRLEGWSGLVSTPWFAHLAVGGLFFPQLVWFTKMLKGSIKIIMEQRKSKVDKWTPKLE